MSENNQWEERSATGKPMVPATPRDVVHIRAGSFILVFCFAMAVLGLIAHFPVLTGIAVVVAVVTVVDMVLAVRRQKSRNVGEAG
ncbi:hypothetical protein HTZ77_34015 [Nonomuraea sp. SMC257]|uniref:Uncharacterized protein n=1 Tax=Nonomuraea montanisoli TaxID=2741721 RepID=A0A7Y6IDR2_9ACTN|nr:hypothetical protein [Nonomuraea montanisoli]NUW36390.1 hypothetical protein [Nonomuraea montanisoli]